MSSCRLFRLFAFVVVSIYPLRSHGAELTFEELHEFALRARAGTSDSVVRAAGVRAAAIDAGTLPNPKLDAEVRPYVSDHDDRDTEYEIGISQQLRLFGGKERRELSRLLDEQAANDDQLALFELKQELRLLYGKAWAVQLRERQTDELLRRTRSITAKIEQLSQQGAAAESSVRFLKAETARLEAELVGLRADRARAFAELVKKTDRDLTDVTLHPLRLDAIPQELTQSNFDAATRAKLARDIAERQSEVARYDAYPSLSPRIGFEHTTDGDERVNAGIEIELPLFNRNEAKRHEAEANRTHRTARDSYFFGTGYATELRLLREAAVASAEQSAVLEKKVLPELRLALAAAEKEFSAGQGNPGQIAQTLLALTETEERSIELWAKALAERTELSILVGKDF